MEYIKLIFSVLVASGFWSFITEVYKTRKKKKTPTEQMILALGRDKLLFLSQKYRDMGYIPLEDNPTYKQLGEAYLSMGGNTNVKELFAECSKLPIK